MISATSPLVLRRSLMSSSLRSRSFSASSCCVRKSVVAVSSWARFRRLFSSWKRVRLLKYSLALSRNTAGAWTVRWIGWVNSETPLRTSSSGLEACVDEQQGDRQTGVERQPG